MKLYNFLFQYTHKGEPQEVYIPADSVREAKEHAESIINGLHYANSYEDNIVAVDENSMDDPKYFDQKILPICAVDSDEQPFPMNYVKKSMLFLASGTNCRCCMGWRIFGALCLGLIIGYLVG
ncbi:hypothetical protein A1D22_05865 [Pasteurellaceae bacterium LFhippo2]|nr:hypothetical protein [Pasteurellaceae bacterium LFhippo2]